MDQCNSQVFWGAVLGIIGAVIAFIINDWIKRSLLKKSIASALHAELSSILEFYMKDFGEYLERAKDWKTFGLGMRITQNYFSVYESNCGNIGLFGRDTAKRIVLTYTQGKALVENMLSWTEKREGVGEYKDLSIHFDRLKDYHKDFMKEASVLKIRLDKIQKGWF